MEQQKLLKSHALLGWLPIFIIALLAFWGCAEEAKPGPHPDGWADDPDSEYFHSRKVAVNGIAFCKSCHGGADANDYYGGSSGVSCYQCHKGGPSGHPAFQLWILSPDSSQFHAQVILTRGWEACQECHGENYRGGIAGVSCYTCHSGGKSGHPALMDWINPQSPDYHGRVLWESDWDFDRCKQCHGTDLNAGGTARGCQSTACHTAPAGIYDCDNCHTTNVTTTFYDVKNNSSSDSSAVGAHLSHVNGVHGLGLAVDCNVCHAVPDSVFTTGHLDESSKINFSGIALNGEATPVYDPTDGTCSNLYCHGSGTPVWTNSSGSDRFCTSCHGQPPLVGAHDTHVNERGLGCSACHSGYNPMIDAGAADSTHINGTVNVNVSTDYGTNAAFSNSSETCSNVYCHGDFEPNWNLADQATCGSCHSLPPATGAHITHVTDQDYSCGTCHSYSPSTHVDLNVDLAIDPQYGGIYDSQSQSCNNVACHNNITVSWTGQELTCGDCHALPPTSGAHIVHVTDQDYDCNVCHTGYSAASETVADSTHINLTKDVTVDTTYGGAYDSQLGSCSGVYCHSDQSVSWSGNITCGDCHAVPQTSNAHLTHTVSFPWTAVSATTVTP